MIIAESIAGEKINARNADRTQSYFCSMCKEAVVLKRGQIKVPHFSHKYDSDCASLYEGETWEHLKGKSDLSDWLAKLGGKPELEVYIEKINQRADVLFEWDSQLYAIEYQCSPITERAIIERTEGYLSIGIKPIWIAGEKLKLGMKLSVIHRQFVLEGPLKRTFHFYYNAQAAELTVTCMSELTSHNHKRRRLVIQKNDEKIDGLFERKKPDFCLLNTAIIKKKKQQLHSMRHYNTNQYRALFDLMYENHLVIDCLPGVLFSEVAEEWTIRTNPIEWKLQLIVFLKNQPDTLLLTSDILNDTFVCLQKKNKIKKYHLPNLTDNTIRIIHHFISLLEQEDYLSLVGKDRWKINTIKYNW